MHWTERRSAMANLSSSLRKLGWTIYGYKADTSDSMTDYYSPADWDGIAVKDGYTVVVDHKKAEVAHDIIKTEMVQDKDCPVCNGTGQCNSGWTLENARKNPVEFNKHYSSHIGDNVIALMASVVSPLHFREIDGIEKCFKCHGRGHTLRENKIVTGVYPGHLGNPPNKLWHVEKDGKIISSGIGLSNCHKTEWRKDSRGMNEYFNPGADSLAEKIDYCTKGNIQSTTTVSQSVNELTITHNVEKNGIELRFPSKPSSEILDSLKSKGFRWSRFSYCWYHSYNEINLAYANSLKGTVDNSTPLVEKVSPFMSKVKALAEMVQRDSIAQLVIDNVSCEENIKNCNTTIKTGRDYTKIDVGHSGMLMIENDTGKIYGIKSYGQVHKGHYYGTLDTISDYYWGHHYPMRKENVPVKILLEPVKVEVEKTEPIANTTDDINLELFAGLV